MGALCSVSCFLHVSVLQLGRDWWPLRREVTPRLMCSHCKEKENAKQGPGIWLWSWRLGAQSCCEQDFVGRISGSAVFLLLFPFSPGCCIKYFPPVQEETQSCRRLWNKGVEPRNLCRPASRAVSPQSTIKSPRSPQSRTFVQ